MFPWWKYSKNEEEAVVRTKRTVKLQHVEVIGGRSATTARRNEPIVVVVGKPRLPHELITQIILLASHSFDDETKRSQNLLRLARVNRSCHDIILSHCILPSLCLTGERQVILFSRCLAQDILNLRRLVHRVRRLSVRRILSSSSSSSNGSGRSLYADVEETARFERATLAPLRLILSLCSGLQHLAFDMSAVSLDLRWPDDMDKGRLMHVCGSLKELVTKLSLYGGDLNERLWDPTYGGSLTTSLRRWSNLTHLQLHGPRFRMTALTALALCDLPALTHLALIMPWVVNATVNAEKETWERHARAIDRANDAFGRQSVLQSLVSGSGTHLQKLVLICHDMEEYLGSVQKLGSWFRALHWVRSPSDDDDNNEDACVTELVLVTATLAQQDTQVHPSQLSKWMLSRTQEQRHWHFEHGESALLDDGVPLSLSVETWPVPVVTV